MGQFMNDMYFKDWLYTQSWVSSDLYRCFDWECNAPADRIIKTWLKDLDGYTATLIDCISVNDESIVVNVRWESKQTPRKGSRDLEPTRVVGLLFAEYLQQIIDGKYTPKGIDEEELKEIKRDGVLLLATIPSVPMVDFEIK